MRRLDLLEIAITEGSAALLTSEAREFAWGPAQETLSFVEGRVFGRIAVSAWCTASPSLIAASSDLTVVSLWPMLDLPSDIEPPSPSEFASSLCRVLTASDVWILWSEVDIGQHAVSEIELSAADAARQVLQLLQGSLRLDVVAYSPSAACRLPPRAALRSPP